MAHVCSAQIARRALIGAPSLFSLLNNPTESVILPPRCWPPGRGLHTQFSSEGTMKLNRFLLPTTYIVGIFACLISWAIFNHWQGARVSILALTILVLSRLLVWSLHGAAAWIGVVFASLVLSLAFVGDAYLLREGGRIRKLAGFMLLAILLFAVLYWTRTPEAFYDPMPGLGR